MATRGRGRPRRAEADAEILDAAVTMLRESGYRALSLDEVARRAGTAKSSIYRRWASKAALAADIVRSEVPAPEGDVVAGFEALMNGPFGGIVASLIGEAQESAETRSIVLGLLAPYRTAGDELLAPILFRRLLNG